MPVIDPARFWKWQPRLRRRTERRLRVTLPRRTKKNAHA
jgi:hypothetical protein